MHTDDAKEKVKTHCRKRDATSLRLLSWHTHTHTQTQLQAKRCKMLLIRWLKASMRASEHEKKQLRQEDCGCQAVTEDLKKHKL